MQVPRTPEDLTKLARMGLAARGPSSSGVPSGSLTPHSAKPTGKAQTKAAKGKQKGQKSQQVGKGKNKRQHEDQQWRDRGSSSQHWERNQRPRNNDQWHGWIDWNQSERANWWER